MSAIAHAIAQQTTAQTTSSAVYTDITGASIASGALTAGKKYLVLASAKIGNTSSNTLNRIRCVHGSTAFAESEMVQARANPIKSVYGWFTVWTAIASEGLKLQFNCDAGTVEVDDVLLVAINLSDDIAEGVDWFYNERSTDDALSTSFLDGGTITFTPVVGSQNWLVMSYAQIDAGDTTNALISQLNRSGEASSTDPQIQLISPSASGIWPMAIMGRVFTLGNVSNTFKERSATGAGTTHTRLHSAVFAINLAKFKNSGFSYTSVDSDISQSAFGTQLETMGITPSVASDLLIGGFAGFVKVNGGRTAALRIQDNNSDEPAGQTSASYDQAEGNDASDVDPLSVMSAPLSVGTSLQTLDLDIGVKTGTGPTFRSHSGTVMGAPATSINQAAPAGVVDNDILVAVLVHPDSVTITPPSGWTQKVASAAYPTAGTGDKLTMFWKRAASEGSSYTFSFSASTTVGIVIGAWKDALQSGDPFSFAATATDPSTTTTFPSISGTTIDPNELILHFGAAVGGINNSVPSSGYTEDRDGGSAQVFINEKAQAAAGATGTVNGTYTIISAGFPGAGAILAGLRPAVSRARHRSLWAFTFELAGGTSVRVFSRLLRGVNRGILRS